MNIGAEMKRQVDALLNTMGETATFRRKARGSYQIGSGTTDGNDANSDESVKVAYIQRNDRFAQLIAQLAGGSQIERGTRRCLMSAQQTDGTALSKTPEPGDFIVGVGDTMKVREVDTYRIGGELACYALEVGD